MKTGWKEEYTASQGRSAVSFPSSQEFQVCLPSAELTSGCISRWLFRHCWGYVSVIRSFHKRHWPVLIKGKSPVKICSRFYHSHTWQGATNTPSPLKEAILSCSGFDLLCLRNHWYLSSQFTFLINNITLYFLCHLGPILLHSIYILTIHPHGSMLLP